MCRAAGRYLRNTMGGETSDLHGVMGEETPARYDGLPDTCAARLARRDGQTPARQDGRGDTCAVRWAGRHLRGAMGGKLHGTMGGVTHVRRLTCVARWAGRHLYGTMGCQTPARRDWRGAA